MDNNQTVGDTKSSSSRHSRGKRSGSGRERDEEGSSVPGAHGSTGDHKSSRKSGKRSSDDDDSKSRQHRSSRSPKRGSRPSSEKAGHRTSRGLPGAQGELTSPRRSRKGDEKGKERRGSRATQPGAEAAMSPGDRRKSRSSARSKKRDSKASPLSDSARSSVPSEGLPYIIGEDGVDPNVSATVVEEEKEDEDEKKEREQARIQEMVAAETQSVRQQMEAENQRLREEMARTAAERQDQEKGLEEKKKKQKKKRRNMTICIALLVLLIAGGVAAFFATQGGSSSDHVTETTDKQEETPVPSSNPTDGPSSVPTTVSLKYEKPGPIECERIAAGLPIDGEEEMVARSFDILMEVILVGGNDIDSRVPQLETQIAKLLVPDLIGCPRALFDKRRLVRHDNPTSNHSSRSMPLHVNHRQLQSMSIRYAIARAMASVTVTDDACKQSSSSNCSVVAVNLDLTVRGEEETVFLAELILDIFPKDQDIRPALDLIAPFDTIIIGTMRSFDPTPTPTMAPTGGTSNENPSTSAPSRILSPGPTSSPLAGPTDPAPPVSDSITSVPTKSPSKSPTAPPSMAPTPTPPPTFAPQPGPSPAPTPPPTASPTKAATNSPTKSPTRNPSAAPSPSPSIQASAAPSPAPTGRPSNRPTSGPTSAPTFNPTAPPTSAPRLGFVPLFRQGMTFEQSATYSAAGTTYAADYAVDGAYNTYTHTPLGSNQWWRANLQDFYGQLVTVNKVTVWNRWDQLQERLEGATVQCYGAGTDNLIAESSPLTRAVIQTVDFGEVTGVQYVQIHLARNDYLSIGEIEAWGSIPNDSNNQGYIGLIKDGMYLEQSTTYSLNGFYYYSNYAVDGNYNNLSQTQLGSNQWWRVRLQQYYGQLVTVNKVTVWNRLDGWQERLEGVTVQLYGAGSNNLIAQSAPLTSAIVQTVDFGEVTGVQYIQVFLSRYDYLNIVEIEAWGKVP